MEKVKKIKLYGIVNQDKFCCIIVGKGKHFFQWLNKLLHGSFTGRFFDVEQYEEAKNNGEILIVKKKIGKYVDKHESYGLKAGRVDLFYGKERVFIIVHSSLKNRKRFMDKLEEFVEFVKYKGRWKPGKALR